jgi:hypothetical protein
VVARLVVGERETTGPMQALMSKVAQAESMRMADVQRVEIPIKAFQTKFRRQIPKTNLANNTQCSSLAQSRVANILRARMPNATPVSLALEESDRPREDIQQRGW